MNFSFIIYKIGRSFYLFKKGISVLVLVFCFEKESNLAQHICMTLTLFGCSENVCNE